MVAEELSKLSIQFLFHPSIYKDEDPDECRSGIFNCNKIDDIKFLNKKRYKVIFHKDKLEKLKEHLGATPGIKYNFNNILIQEI